MVFDVVSVILAVSGIVFVLVVSAGTLRKTTSVGRKDRQTISERLAHYAALMEEEG